VFASILLLGLAVSGCQVGRSSWCTSNSHNLLKLLCMRRAGAHHGLALANAHQLISASPTVGNAVPANDGAFTISSHVPAMRLVCRAPNTDDVPCMHSQHTA
jgi:hypothetical protein